MYGIIEMKNKCSEHYCNQCNLKHTAHEGPVVDTGLGHKICESCQQVTEVYAPI
jgi:hypothetical protein